MDDRDVYPFTSSYVRQTGQDELEKWRISHRLNIACARYTDKVIQEHRPNAEHECEAIAEEIEQEYGHERLALVVANTVLHNSWDSRYSPQARSYATSVNVPQDVVHGVDFNAHFCLTSHPLFVDSLAVELYHSQNLHVEMEDMGMNL